MSSFDPDQRARDLDAFISPLAIPQAMVYISYQLGLYMITAGLVVFIEFFTGEKMTEEKTQDLSKKASFVTILLMLCAGGYMVWVFASAIDANTVVNETVFIDEQREPIASLSDSFQTSGSFFLGTGSISEKPYYFYYAGTKTHYLKKVPAEGTGITQDTDVDPYLSIKTEVTKTCRKNGHCDYERAWSKTYEFHVPANTLTREFRLDGEMR